MEDNTIRKIKLVLRDKDSLLLLLDQLETGRGEVEAELMIKDTKSNYSLLATSPSVLDWDFITAEESRQEKGGWDDTTKISDSEFRIN